MFDGAIKGFQSVMKSQSLRDFARTFFGYKKILSLWDTEFLTLVANLYFVFFGCVW